jgi:hypothetical protein
MSEPEAAWQAALAAEHAAVAGYDVLGPRLTDRAEVTLARSCQQAHRDLRDRTAASLRDAGLQPVAALPGYPLPFAVADPGAARQFAVRLESGCASAWRYVIAVAAQTASSNRPLRSDAQAALTASALLATRWRGLADPAMPTVAFPGI